MSPWPENHRPRWPLYVGITFVALGMVLGLLLMLGTFAGNGGDPDNPVPDTSSGTPATPATSATSASPEATASAPPSAPAPEVVSWGQQGRQLAVVVRNDSDQVVDHARVRITGVDAAGRTVVSTVGTANHVCCTVFGLQPGDRAGIYAPLRPGARKVADVQVEYVDPVLRAVRKREGAVTASGASLERSADDTVVTATLRARGPVGPFVAAQALLVDAEGRVAQVISGRYWCYESGTRRRIRLELYRPVPAGLRLDEVVAHSIPAGAPAGVPAGAQGVC